MTDAMAAMADDIIPELAWRWADRCAMAPAGWPVSKNAPAI